MPMKRGRIGSSSSNQPMQISTADTAMVNSSTVMKAGETSKILYIERPVGVGESDQVKLGGFLEQCHYCKKRIAQNSDVFMYSNLCAFCSSECRDHQIAIDRLANKKPANPKGKVPRG